MPLPKPDGFGDINRASQLTKEQIKAEKKRKKKERRHPKDGYQPLKEKKSCSGAGCLFLFVLLIFLPVGGAALWVNHLKTEFTDNQGYSWITIREKNLVTAPEEKTAYLGAQVLYEAPETHAEVAFIGGSWWLSGTFHEKVSFRGGQLTLEPGSRFLKGLDVEAAKFIDNGAEITGELTGRIMQQEVAK